MDAASNSDNRSLAIVSGPANQTDLVEKTFYRILDVLKQLGVHRQSPKFFVIYAHENEKRGIEANKTVATNYIEWFKKCLFNVDSDKSPHGYGPAHAQAHIGASVNIVQNQICLLPRSWHEHNVDYVLVFYSRLLATYMQEEDNFKINDRTYSEAVSEVCSRYDKEDQRPWEKICEEVSKVQQDYSDKMNRTGNLEFHHVLTELALLKFRQKIAPQYAIPILLFDEASDSKLGWQPSLLGMKETQLWLGHKSGAEHERFFKILLMFETLENDRPIIEALQKCYRTCVGLLKKPEGTLNYHTKMEVEISQALQRLNDDKRHWTMERPLTRDGIRDILNLRSLVDRMSMKRVSGNKLPDNFRDISLAVANDGGAKDEGWDPTISASLNETSSEQIKRHTVSINSLFDEREILDEEKKRKTIQPKRVLIHGKPGVGKTTLSKRIMYEYSWHDSLRRRFDLVVRVPVRKLKQVADLADLLFDEYFQAATGGHELSERLKDLMLGKENASVLIILDGLDEVRQWSLGKRTLLNKLMSQSAVIITSRIYNANGQNNSHDLPIDLHIEALGHSTNSLRAYVENPDIVPSSTRRYILNFIKSNPSIREMARVPLHLDIICYSWDELHRKKASFMAVRNAEEPDVPTTTTLYRAIVHRLWRKDIPGLNKRDNGEQVTTEVLDAIRDATRLERVVFPETRFLEEVAIHLMDSNQFEFADKDINEVIRRLESGGIQLPLSLECNLQKLSFLHSKDRDQQREFSFIHLTFQEFFAAQGFTKDIQRLNKYVRQYKYSRRFERIWRFVAGLLQDDTYQLCRFFIAIEEEPRDLLGLAHQRLVMKCLSEVALSKQETLFDKVRLDLENQLSKWLRFEHGFHDSLILKVPLAQATEISAEVLCNALTQESEDERLRESLLEAIATRSQIPSSVITLTTGWLRTDTFRSSKIAVLVLRLLQRPHQPLPQEALDRVHELLNYNDNIDILNIRAEAAEVLKHQSKLPSGILRSLLSTLKGNDESVGWRAARVLEAQSELPSDILRSLLSTLKGNDESVGWRAARVLEAQSELPSDILRSLLSTLKGNDESVGLRAARVLKHQSELSPDILRSLLNMLRNKDKVVGWRAAEILKHQSELPPDILRSLLNMLRNEDTYRRAARVLGFRETLPSDILSQSIEMLKDNSFMVEALIILGRQTTLSPDVFARIAAMVELEDSREAASNILKRQNTLPPNSWAVVSRWLSDDNLRPTAIRILQNKLSDSPPDILTALAELLQNENSNVRTRVVSLLQDQSVLPLAVLNAMARALARTCAEAQDEDACNRLKLRNLKAIEAMLRHRDRDIRQTVDQTLEDQAVWLKYTSKAIEAALKDKNYRVRWKVIDILNRQRDLPTEILLVVVAALRNESTTRSEAAGILGNQVDLPIEVIEAMVAMLKDDNRDYRVAALRAVIGRSDLPLSILTIIVAMLKDGDKDFRADAVQICGRQSSLPGELLEAVVGMLEDGNEHVRRAAADVIERTSAFPLTDLREVMGRKYKPVVRRWLTDTIRNGQLTFPGGFIPKNLKTLYHTWLWKSFGRYWCWYVVGEVSYIETSEGRMEIPLNGQGAKLVEAIQEIQTKMGHPHAPSFVAESSTN